MKRTKRNRALKLKEPPEPASTVNEQSDSEDEGGFSKWLRSNEGVELLKFFVLGNALIAFLVMTWPNIHQAFDSAYYIIKGEDIN